MRLVPLTDYDVLQPATNRNDTRQEPHKYRALVAARNLDSRHFLTGTCALTTQNPKVYPTD